MNVIPTLTIVIPYKNRVVNFNSEVSVYRNLHKGPGVWYSVIQDGVVVGHTQEIAIRNAHFVVREGGRRRVIKTGRKNVHAFVVGQITTDRSMLGKVLPHSAGYNPRCAPKFTVDDCPISTADLAVLTKYGLLVCNPH